MRFKTCNIRIEIQISETRKLGRLSIPCPNVVRFEYFTQKKFNYMLGLRKKNQFEGLRQPLLNHGCIKPYASHYYFRKGSSILFFCLLACFHLIIVSFRVVFISSFHVAINFFCVVVIVDFFHICDVATSIFCVVVVSFHIVVIGSFQIVIAIRHIMVVALRIVVVSLHTITSNVFSFMFLLLLFAMMLLMCPPLCYQNLNSLLSNFVGWSLELFLLIIDNILLWGKFFFIFSHFFLVFVFFI